ncbi:probable N-acetyltransferase camello isoform X2 [Engystomops pustulosus]
MSSCKVRLYQESDLLAVREIFTAGCCEHILPSFYNALRQPHNWLLLVVGLLLPMVTTGSIALSILCVIGVLIILWYPGNQFFHYHLNHALVVDLKDVRKYYLQREDYCFWVAELDGEVVGIVAAIPFITQHEKNVELKRMAVSRHHRGKGIAKKLCRTVIDYAQKKGCNAVILSTTTVEVGGWRLYEAVGFRPSHTKEQNTLLLRLAGISWLGYRYDICTST